MSDHLRSGGCGTGLPVLLIAVCLSAGTAPVFAAETTASAYVRARSVLPVNLRGLVKNESVQAQWFPAHESFWYKRDSETGAEYVIVDAHSGDKRKAFDHQRLSEAIAAAADSQPEPGQIRVSGMNLQNGGLVIKLSEGGKSYTCTTGTYSCSESTEPPPEMNLLPSPDGNYAAFVRENNLWVRSMETGQERQMTLDGEPYHGYGTRYEQQKFEELRSGMEFPVPPSATHWSADGRKLIVQQLDERRVLDYPFVEMAPENGGFRPALYSVRIPLLGDADDRLSESYIIDIESGKRSLVRLDEGFVLDYFGMGNTPLAWSRDGDRVFMLTANSGASVVQLVEVNLDSGETHVLIEETSGTSVTLNHGVINANVRILDNGSEAVWFSEQDGWGHLYLYDISTGKVKNRITSGDWLVWDIVHLDEARRQVFFTAGGLEVGRDPYYRHLYKAPLDGGDITLLTPENADHDIKTEFTSGMQQYLAGIPGNDSPASSPGFFIDTWSTVEQAPVTVLRSADDGRLISRLEEADTSKLYSAGWRAPRRFSVKAADGQSDIHGVLYLPSDFNPDKNYPVIDAIYGGPVSIVASRSFQDAYGNGYFPASVAELGFAVVMLDGRGTPYRSRAFREAGFGSFADPQLEDHVAAIRQLAERHSFLDISRVGIYGHSNGGYLSARALLKYPDFFKVGFASAGPQNFQGLPGTGAPWFGVPDYGNGATLRPEVGAVPENYKILDNASYAEQLQGRLMLVCGELDYTAFPALTMQLAAALIEANKNFDFLYLPGSTHRYFVDDLYVTRRLWDYFTEYLAGQAPPQDFDMNSAPP